MVVAYQRPTGTSPVVAWRGSGQAAFSALMTGASGDFLNGSTQNTDWDTVAATRRDFPV